MKNRLHQLLMLFVMSIVSLSSWADRVAPTLPEGEQIVSGNTYCLYNVEAEGFVKFNCQGSYVNFGIESTYNTIYQQWYNYWPRPFTFSEEETDKYSIQSGVDGYAIYDFYCYVGGADEYYSKFYVTFEPQDGKKYKIRAYNSESYVGWTKQYGLVRNGNTDGQTWILMTYDNACHYVAELALYDALCSWDGKTGNEWFLKPYEEMYADRANRTTNELNNAANIVSNGLNNSGYTFPSWNEYPMMFNSDFTMNYNTSDGGYFAKGVSEGASASMSAIVEVDQPACITYDLSAYDYDIHIYVDDQEVRHVNSIFLDDRNRSYAGYNQRYFEHINAGRHTIKWTYTNTSSQYGRTFYICNIGCFSTPLITVSLLEPGSLGTEVLYNVDRIQDVKRLKVIGEMNSDDWAKIQMMTKLHELDLSEAKAANVPNNQFDGQTQGSEAKLLHKVILPDDMKSIGDYAFRYTYIDTLHFPKKATSIGKYAFNRTNLGEAILPDSLTSLGENAFESNFQLFTVKTGKKITSIPTRAFYDCRHIVDMELPNTISAIGDYAFYQCHNLKADTLPSNLKTIGKQAFCNCCYRCKPVFPDGLTTIGSYAFDLCTAIDTLRIPQSVTNIAESAFYRCNGMKYAEVPMRNWQFASNVFQDCWSLNRLKLYAGNVVGYNTEYSNDTYKPLNNSVLANVTLVVPSYLVTSYKLDKYWYQAKAVEGFSTGERKDWIIYNPLVMNHDRFEGEPNIYLQPHGGYIGSSYLKFNGAAEQHIDTLTVYGDWNGYNNLPAQIMCTSENTKVNGGLSVDLYVPSMTWEFFSLPFDCKISEMWPISGNVQYAIRYYDGANRAANGANGSWKNFDKENDIIPAGTGFIIQANKTTWCRFYSVDNDMKQNMVSYKEFSKTLDVNDCETASNKGWNLIGNPYQCFYNDHMLNFTAPITVWNNYNKNYVAYSLTDDDYAIRPNEAFFVQCPSAEYSTITFPLQGRQLNDVIESQNAAKVGSGFTVQGSGLRKIVNLTLSNGEQTDQTRIVLNEKASLSYEMTCDASKFMSMDNGVPQLYTVGSDGTQYAINERPEADGTVQLGFYAAAAGSYTIALGRCDAESVYLLDNETGETTEITNSGYTFNAEAGANTGRFVVVFKSGEATGITSYQNENQNENSTSVYNLAGQRVDNANKGIFIINGKKVIK